jgi:hypothetical protein
MELWAEEGEKESEKVEIEVRQDEFGTEKKKYLVTKEERDRIWGMERALMETFNAIEKAYRDKEIDLDTKLMYEIKALEEPQLVPEKYRPAGYGKEKPDLKYHLDEVHRVYRDISGEWFNLEPETHFRLRSYVKRYLEEHPRDPSKPTTEDILIREAHMKGEIDLETAILYHECPFLVPKKYKPEKKPFIPHLFITGEQTTRMIRRYWGYLSPEMKEKLRITSWRHGWGSWQKRSPDIEITSPTEGKEIYTPRVTVEGTVSVVEVYPVEKIWIKQPGKDGLKVTEVDLGEGVLQRPKITKEDLKEYERQDGKELPLDLAQYLKGPGKIIYTFKKEINLEKFGKTVISVGTKPEGYLERSSVWIYHYDGTDKEPPKVKIKDPKEGAILRWVDVTEEEHAVIYTDVTDNKRVLRVEIFLNGKLVDHARLTDSPEEDGVNTYIGGAPVKIGKNEIKVVAYDIGNNSKSDTVKVTYSPEKR